MAVVFVPNHGVAFVVSSPIDDMIKGERKTDWQTQRLANPEFYT
jgi:hypothetical protein